VFALLVARELAREFARDVARDEAADDARDCAFRDIVFPEPGTVRALRWSSDIAVAGMLIGQVLASDETVGRESETIGK
jgi:hypothetical protein